MKASLPAYAVRTAKLLSELGISQVELSRLAGIDQSTVSHYLSGRRAPGTFQALIFAGLASASDAPFWLEFAEITDAQRALIAKGMEIQAPPLPGYEEQLVRTFLRFWRKPDGVVRKHLRELLKTTVFEDIEHPAETE